MSHDGDAVGDIDDFVELVRDQDNRAAAIAQTAEDPPKLLHLGRREDRGRLIENQEARATKECLENLDALRFAHGEVAHEPTDIHVEAKLLGDALHLELRARHVDRNAARRLAAQHDVFGDGERRHEHEVLVHHADAGLDRLRGAPPGDVAPSDLDRAGIWRIKASDDPHERRLAGPILADDRVNLTGLDLERRSSIRANGTK